MKTIVKTLQENLVRTLRVKNSNENQIKSEKHNKRHHANSDLQTKIQFRLIADRVNRPRSRYYLIGDYVREGDEMALAPPGIWAFRKENRKRNRQYITPWPGPPNPK